jgi:hypothetical protein
VFGFQSDTTKVDAFASTYVKCLHEILFDGSDRFAQEELKEIVRLEFGLSRNDEVRLW